MTSPIAPLTLITGESLLSLYPIIVKSSPLSIPIQAFSRILVYSVIPLFFADASILLNIPIWKWIFAGVTNLLHIWSSYEGFQRLPAGFATTILYLYPILNLVLARVILGEELSLSKILLFIVPVVLLYQLYSEKQNGVKQTTSSKSQPTSPTFPSSPPTPTPPPSTPSPSSLTQGTLFMLLSALTESLLYLIIKTTPLGANMWNPILFVYLGALILGITGWTIGSTLSPALSISLQSILSPEFAQISIYNALIGMFGYMFRFWSIPRMNTLLYSVLSYTGIITSHIFGYLFFSETLTSQALVYLSLFIVSLITIKLI